jgi:uncharacterized peroxidase-related enzyme
VSFYIKTIPNSDATGKLRDFYDADKKDLGLPSNTTRSFSLHPEAWEGWMSLIKSIRKDLRLRNYELTTFAAAMEMGCTFCMLAHGAVLRRNFFTAEQLEAIARDFRHAGLEPKEVLMMEYAQKVVRDASSTTAADIEQLRQTGWTDEDILSITLAAAARSFASKVFDALDAPPDPIYKELDEETHHALVGKRPYAA